MKPSKRAVENVCEHIVGLSHFDHISEILSRAYAIDVDPLLAEKDKEIAEFIQHVAHLANEILQKDKEIERLNAELDLMDAKVTEISEIYEEKLRILQDDCERFHKPA